MRTTDDGNGLAARPGARKAPRKPARMLQKKRCVPEHSLKDPLIAAAVREIGGKLCTLRRIRGYETGAEASRAIGISPHLYQKLERGKSNVRIGTLMRILRGLDSGLGDLASQAPSPPNPRGGYRVRPEGADRDLM
jgi:Helix-turn-helix